MAEEMNASSRLVDDEISQLFPDAHCELRYRTELELLVAVMLSAQTTDEAVNQTTLSLFQTYRTVDDYANADLADLEQGLRHLGLYKTKANYLKSTCLAIRERFGGVIPADQSALESLPGVGRKTANVFLSEWFHLPRFAVDTHVHRVSLRLGFANQEDSLLLVEQKLMDAFPADRWTDLHHKFIFFGRYFCTAKRPKCAQCPLVSICLKPFL